MTETEFTDRLDGRGKPGKTITYAVNGEPLTTTEHNLSVHALLTAAGFTPVEDYRLTRDRGNHVYDDYDQEIPLQDGEKFTATFLGVTPTS